MSTSIIAVETVLPATSVSKAGTSYSNSLDFTRCQGDASVWIASTAGSITVTQQCSLNNSDWYDPVGATGSAYGGIASALTVTTGIWISYTPVMAPFVRFKIVEGNVAASTVTLKLIFREEA